MMPVGNLARMVVANTLRSPRHFILSAFGIVIGIGAFVLFLALTQRAGAVLEKVFPLDEVQVVAPSVSLAGVDTSKRLDDAIVQQILARPEVADAVPRMNLAFPAAGRGDFEGKDFRLELGGFADGVNPGVVKDDARILDLFRDWDAVKDDPNRIACVPPPPDPDDPVRSAPGGPKRAAAARSSSWDAAPAGSAAPRARRRRPPPPPGRAALAAGRVRAAPAGPATVAVPAPGGGPGHAAPRGHGGSVRRR